MTQANSTNKTQAPGDLGDSPHPNANDCHREEEGDRPCRLQRAQERVAASPITIPGKRTDLC